MKIIQKLYIQAVQYSFENEPTISVNGFKCYSTSNSTVIDIDEVEFEFEVPDDILDILNVKKITELEKKKRIIFTKAEADINQLDEIIKSLS